MSQLIKELENIIANEKDVIPFLKQLTDADKKAISPHLKKIKNRVFERIEIREKDDKGRVISFSSKQTHSNIQRDIVMAACFVCFSKTSVQNVFKNWDLADLLTSKFIRKRVLHFYCPSWYGEFLNGSSLRDFVYEDIMYLYNKNYMKITNPEMIVGYLQTGKRTYSSLFEYQETIENHIWYLFEQESTICWGHKERWHDIFLRLDTENHIDRTKLLKATIHTVNKGFTKNLSNWFMDLLVKLNPTEQELLALQEDIVLGLSSPQSKVLNTFLKFCKNIGKHPDFNYQYFLENATLVLNTTTKSVVNTALSILEIIAKTHPKSTLAVCTITAEALLFSDEKIQTKAAKIIANYGNPKELKAVLENYNSVPQAVKTILVDYNLDNTEIAEDYTSEIVEELLSDKNKLTEYNSIDDLIFFISQALDNNEVYHTDLFLSYFPKLYTRLDKETIQKLMPFFKRAINIVLQNNNWWSKIGRLGVYKAAYVYDVIRLLATKHPEALKKTQAFITKELARVEQRFGEGRITQIKSNMNGIENIPDQEGCKTYTIYKSLLVTSKQILTKELSLELLSTPTHQPCWIDPKILVDRIIAFETVNEPINPYDFQIAIGRLPVTSTFDTIKNKFNSVKNEEIKSVLAYHFKQFSIEKCIIKTPELWVQSVLQNPKDAQYLEEQTPYNFNIEYSSWDWETTKKVSYETIASKQHNSTKEPVNSIYNHIEFSYNVNPNDAPKFLLLFPNTPNVFMKHATKSLGYARLDIADDQKSVVQMLQELIGIWDNHNSTAPVYLFVATALLSGYKNARDLATELWIKTVSKNTMNTQKFGKYLGKLQHNEYGPLKRFTDIAFQSLLNISKQHNTALLALLDAMISEMHNKPIKNTKKVLELYTEVLHLQKVEISSNVKEKLTIWSETKSLKPIIKKLLA